MRLPGALWEMGSLHERTKAASLRCSLCYVQRAMRASEVRITMEVLPLVILNLQASNLQSAGIIPE